MYFTAELIERAMLFASNRTNDYYSRLRNMGNMADMELLTFNVHTLVKNIVDVFVTHTLHRVLVHALLHFGKIFFYMEMYFPNVNNSLTQLHLSYRY